MTATIAEQSTAYTAAAAGDLPPHVSDAFRTERSALDAAGVPRGVAGIGDAMPDGALLDETGAPTTLAAARGGTGAVVVFYRGAWCPYCNIALRTYEKDLAGELRERGVAMIAISPQHPDGSLAARRQNELTFRTLSDPGNGVARGLGIVAAPSGGALEAQRALGLDVRGKNADGTAELPMPTVVLVDGGGTIRWIDVHPNYATRTESAAILEAVARL